MFRFTVVDASKCTQRDIININKKKDLMPIILANHRNELVNESTGPRHKITYNFGLLEKKVGLCFSFCWLISVDCSTG